MVYRHARRERAGIYDCTSVVEREDDALDRLIAAVDEPDVKIVSASYRRPNVRTQV